MLMSSFARGYLVSVNFIWLIHLCKPNLFRKRIWPRIVDIQSRAGIQRQDESHTKSKAGGTSESHSLGEDYEREGKVGAVSKPCGMKSEGRTRLKKEKGGENQYTSNDLYRTSLEIYHVGVFN